MNNSTTTPSAAHLVQVNAIVDEYLELHRLEAEIAARKTQVLARGALLAGQIAAGSATSSLVSSSHDLARRLIQTELGAAIRVTDRTVSSWMDTAERLTRYSKVLNALEAGEISYRHATTISEAGIIVSDDQRILYETAVLDVACEESVNRLQPIAEHLAAAFSELTVDERQHEAQRNRCVMLQPLGEGLAKLTAILPATAAQGIYDRVSQMAWQQHRVCKARQQTQQHETSESIIPPNDQNPRRTIPQLRADILADMLLTSDPAVHSLSSTHFAGGEGLQAIRGRVQVTVPVAALLPQHEAARIQADPALSGLAGLAGIASLAGHGPVDTATARRIAGNATVWDRILTHPITGAVLHVDRYRPSEAIRRTLGARDEHCRFPGCRIPINRCDLDHTIDAAHGGSTSTQNLAHLCRRHHTVKHHTPWKVKQRSGGVLEWQSPTRRRYEERPPSTVRFRATSRASAAPPLQARPPF